MFPESGGKMDFTAEGIKDQSNDFSNRSYNQESVQRNIRERFSVLEKLNREFVELNFKRREGSNSSNLEGRRLQREEVVQHSSVAELFDRNVSTHMEKALKENIEKKSYQKIASWFRLQGLTIDVDFDPMRKALYVHNIKNPISIGLLELLENGGFIEALPSSDNVYERKMADRAYKSNRGCFYLLKRESIERFLQALGIKEDIIQKFFQ